MKQPGDTSRTSKWKRWLFFFFTNWFTIQLFHFMHHIECFFFSSCCWTLWIVNLLQHWLAEDWKSFGGLSSRTSSSQWTSIRYVPQYTKIFGLHWALLLLASKNAGQNLPSHLFAENVYFSKRLFHAFFFREIWNDKRGKTEVLFAAVAYHFSLQPGGS